MSESRRVLAVDNQRATVDFLRSVLPLIEGESFEIQRVLSAEEGLLELRRRPYDLLITGLRLPGMDGLELSRRAKSLRPHLPVVLASDKPLPELQAMASGSQVDYLMRKPLDAEEFLDAVQQSLAAVPPATTIAGENGITESPAALPSAIVRRLDTLGDETGAGQVILATVAGEILYATGGQLHRDIPRLVASAAASVSRGLDLSRQLNEEKPRAVQFVEGESTDLYWANIGFEHFIAILFDAQVRRGRIGTVWVFTQRAVNALREQLAELQQANKTEPQAPAKPAVVETANADEPSRGAGPSPRDQYGTAGQAAEMPDASPIMDTVTAQEATRTPAEQELDAFWEEALASDGGDDVFGAGISLEEARAKGLIGEDFDPDGLQTGADD